MNHRPLPSARLIVPVALAAVAFTGITFGLNTLSPAHSRETAALHTKQKTDIAPPPNPADSILAGKQLVEARCSLCHSAPTPEMHTRDEWTGILNIMGPRANLKPEEATLILDYLRQEEPATPGRK